MPLPAIPVIMVGAMKLYRAYQVAKFVKVAYSSFNSKDNLNENPMTKFLNIGKEALGLVDAIALKGTAGLMVKGLVASNTLDKGVSMVSKIGEAKNVFTNNSGTGKGLMDKLGTLKSVVGILADSRSVTTLAKTNEFK